MTQTIARSFFHQHPLGTIATLSADGMPTTAAVYYTMEDNFTCYFVTRETTRKYENCLQRHVATLSAFDENVLMFGEIRGVAEVVGDLVACSQKVEELQGIIASRKTDYWIPPVSQLEGRQYVIMKLIPKQVQFVNYDIRVSDDPQPIVLSLDFS